MHLEDILKHGFLKGLRQDLTCNCDRFIGILEDLVCISLPILQLQLVRIQETLCKLETLLAICFKAQLRRLILKGHAACHIPFPEGKEGI